MWSVFMSFMLVGGSALTMAFEGDDMGTKERDVKGAKAGISAKATFAAGCFWGVQQVFDQVKGVVSTRAGYAGGTVVAPTYEQVCSGTTGHAESVEVVFDPGVVSYRQLLDLFWKIHDPTTLDRQGPDVGHQYRSAIFTHGEEQRREALDSLARLEREKRFPSRIVTVVVPATTFYPAEDYHQKYNEKNGVSCHIVP